MVEIVLFHHVMGPTALPAHDAEASRLVVERVLGFLTSVGGGV